MKVIGVSKVVEAVKNLCIEIYPCNVASMPLAINMACHVNSHRYIRL